MVKSHLQWAEKMTHLPTRLDNYNLRVRLRAQSIIKDTSPLHNLLFSLPKSNKYLCSNMLKNERLKRSSYPQAIWILNKNFAPLTLYLVIGQ